MRGGAHMSGPGETDAALRCPVCGRDNDGLAVKCSACGAFIQDRVPALDFFDTLYGLIEDPSRTLSRIARSEQKNYVYTLFALLGPFFAASTLVLLRAGDGALDAGELFAVLYLAGFPAGILFGITATALLKPLLSAFAGRRLRYRSVAALTAWSLAPFSVAYAILISAQFAIFGRAFFSWETPPAELKPAAFWILTGLQALAASWSVMLLSRSFRMQGVRSGLAAAAVFLLSALAACVVAAAVAALSGFAA